MKRSISSYVASLIPGETVMYNDCRKCPGYGRWEHYQYVNRDLCFRKAIFLNKPGKPEDCVDARLVCGRFSTATGDVFL